MKANKGKFNLKTRASTALAATFAASNLKGAPSQIAPELRIMAAAIKDLAAAPTDAAFKIKHARFSTPAVQKAYGRITFFGVRACKFPK